MQMFRRLKPTALRCPLSEGVSFQVDFPIVTDSCILLLLDLDFEVTRRWLTQEHDHASSALFQIRMYQISRLYHKAKWLQRPWYRQTQFSSKPPNTVQYLSESHRSRVLYKFVQDIYLPTDEISCTWRHVAFRLVFPLADDSAAVHCH